MHEYVTKAVVLDKATRNDADARYSFFTERFGKIAAKATSSRKIVSRLAGHLEPGTVAAVRIIETRGTQVVDALKLARVEIPMRDLISLNNLLPEWEPDADLWREFRNHAKTKRSVAGSFDAASFWTNTLAILGWDPRGAVCVNCGLGDARHFYIPRQEFFCTSCTANIFGASRFMNNQLLLI